MANAPHVWIPKVLTKLDYLKSTIAPARKKTVSPGSYLSDLVCLKQTVLLCFSCEYKFHQIAKRVGYRKTPFDADATCDDCRKHSLNAKVFAHEENYKYHIGCGPVA